MSSIQDPLYPGSTVKRKYTFKDEFGTAFDPDTVTVTVIDPKGSAAQVLNLQDLTKVSTGVYRLQFNIPTAAVSGQWFIEVNAAYGSENKVKLFFFRVFNIPQ